MRARCLRVWVGLGFCAHDALACPALRASTAPLLILSASEGESQRPCPLLGSDSPCSGYVPATQKIVYPSCRSCAGGLGYRV